MVNDGQAGHSGNINKTDADLATREVARYAYSITRSRGASVHTTGIIVQSLKALLLTLRKQLKACRIMETKHGDI